MIAGIFFHDFDDLDDLDDKVTASEDTRVRPKNRAVSATKTRRTETLQELSRRKVRRRSHHDVHSSPAGHRTL